MTKLRLVVPGCLLLLASAMAGQEPVRRDPEGVSILQIAFQAMGGANLASVRDTRSVVHFTSYRDGKQESGEAVLKTYGRTMSSGEVSGRVVFTMDDRRGAVNEGSGESKRVPRMAVASAGITQIPVLSVLADWGSPDVRIEYLGLEKGDAGAFHVVRMQRKLPEDLPFGEFDLPCDFYIDSQTYLVAKLIYRMRPPINLLHSEPVEIHYGDYRPAGEIAVPFHVTYFIRGQRLSEYRVTAFATNQGAQPADFVPR